MPDGLFVIRTFANAMEAQLAESVLEAHDIPCVLLKDNAGGMLPWLDVLHPVRLAVRESDVTEAVALLDGDTPPDDAA